ncbi:MAG: hypothetical protein IKF09_07225 [Clostridiales bacterium]|nr:hypothetical protein [Clostridiales bacterium]
MPGKESLQDVFANALDTALREKLNGVETQEDLNEALQSIDVTSLFIQFLDKTSEGIMSVYARSFFASDISLLIEMKNNIETYYQEGSITDKVQKLQTEWFIDSLNEYIQQGAS